MAKLVSNWAGNQVFAPRRIATPASEDELAQVVADAAKQNLRVRVVGANHSWSPVVATEDVLVSLDRLDQVLATEGRRVTVQGGIRLGALNLRLAERGLAMPNLGSIDRQSIAGAISTATHGSGCTHGVLSTTVSELRLMGPDGQVQALSAEHRPELFDAARAGLGLFGIITAVTLDCEPAFRLREHTVPMRFDQVVADLDALIHGAEYPRLWWLPHTEVVQLFSIDRSEDPSTTIGAMEWLNERVLNPVFFPLILKLGAAVPALIPVLNRIIARSYFADRIRVGQSHRVLHVPEPPRHLEAEYAIGLERLGEALPGLRRIIDEGDLKVNFVQEIRFVKADRLPLSPAYGRETAYVAAYSANPRHMDRFLRAFEAMMEDLEGRPHWGKLFNRSPEQLRALYPEWDRVMALRQEVDPEGRFLNPFTQRVLGLA